MKGQHEKFDDESRSLYDAVAPTLPDSHFQKILDQLEKKIPGKGPLAERYEQWRKSFIIPKDKLDTVFQLAIKETRARTLAHIKLPPNEGFKVEYVTDKPWGGYNWYKGDYQSVIQVNTDVPAYIDRAIDLAAHEGYPGHHVYNALLEKNLVRDRKFVEFSFIRSSRRNRSLRKARPISAREVVFNKADRMAVREEGALARGRPRSETHRGILRRAGDDAATGLRRQRSRAQNGEWRNGWQSRGRLAAKICDS